MKECWFQKQNFLCVKCLNHLNSTRKCSNIVFAFLLHLKIARYLFVLSENNTINPLQRSRKDSNTTTESFPYCLLTLAFLANQESSILKQLVYFLLSCAISWQPLLRLAKTMSLGPSSCLVQEVSRTGQNCTALQKQPER